MSERQRAERRPGAGAGHRAARSTRAAARVVLPALALGALLAGCALTPSPTGAATPTIGSAVSAPPTPSAPGTTATGTTGTTATGTTAPTGPAGPGPVGPEEQRVAQVLQTYLGAVASGDHGLACTQMTPESATALLTAVQQAGGQVPACPEALGAVLQQAGAAQTATDAFSTAAVADVTIDGLTATVRWTSTQRGVPRTDALTMQNLAGQWRLAGPA